MAHVLRDEKSWSKDHVTDLAIISDCDTQWAADVASNLMSVPWRGFTGSPQGFQSSESPHTSRSILFLAMAACGMIWPSLVQPHCLLGALSNTRPRHPVPTAGIGPRSGSLGPSPVVPSHLWFFSNGSHVATGFLSATLWLNKASTLPTKCPRPQRQASLWGTSTLLNVGWDV